MSLEKAFDILQEFKRIRYRVAYIQQMYEEDMTTNFEVKALSAEHPGFVESAYELLDNVKEFVKLIEESDTNLDLETTKLEGVDKFFEGHEATAFVNNALHEVYNGLDSQQQHGENEIHDHLFEGLCWCGFKQKLKRMNLTVDTAPISAYMLSSIEATKDVEGKCFHCAKECSQAPCKAEDKNCCMNKDN